MTESKRPSQSPDEVDQKQTGRLVGKDRELIPHGPAANTELVIESKTKVNLAPSRKKKKKRSTDLSSPKLYINRELSFLEFNHRVLALARERKIPLLERLFYLCICSSNLDEFFEVRVAGLQKQSQAGAVGSGPDRLKPDEQLQRISIKAHRMVRQQYKVLNNELLPALEANGISFPPTGRWSKKVKVWARAFFDNELLPVLSPLGLDPAHPFPQLMNKSLNFIVSLKGKDAFGRDTSMAVVRAPRSLPRIIPVPDDLSDGRKQFVLLSTMIQHNMPRLFPGLQTQGAYQFRVTRNSDLYLADEDVADLRLALQDGLNARDYGQAVRLEVGDDCPEKIIDFLLQQFNLNSDDLYICHGPVNLNRLQKLPQLIERAELKYPVHKPVNTLLTRSYKNTFAEIRRRDVLLHYPYQSSDVVVALLRTAARDKKVLAIKQTLYRTGTDSAYADALIDAAHQGKDVTVVIELRARFDEQANIALATRLQRAGVQVVYGVVGYKTHAKMILIVRREKNVLSRYAHISTGNYHTGTSRTYTDVSLLTCNKSITSDVQKIFNQLTGLGQMAEMKKMLHAPFTMRASIIDRIDNQAVLAQAGKPAAIKARMNALNDPLIIQALYRASNAGVDIQLLVRGICTLRPGVKGVSENIRVYSVVGRFLEHSRIYAFGAKGEEQVFLSSADWMPRNMLHRVEVAVPVLDDDLRQRVVQESLNYYFADNQLSWMLESNGEYKRKKMSSEPFSAQQKLLKIHTKVARRVAE